MPASVPSAMPTSLRIGPYTWQVFCSKKAWAKQDKSTRESSDGVCHTDTHKIIIAPKLPLEYERICLLHEILHACRDSVHLLKLDLNDAEESFINAVSPALYGVLQDNPDLLDYLGLGLT